MQVFFMRFAICRVLSCALVVLTIVIPATLRAPRAYAEGPCTARSDNLTRNGSINDGYDTQYGVVANSWNAFIFDRTPPSFDLVDNENAVGDSVGQYSQYIHGDGVEFDAGIYQVIAGTTPGQSYDFKIGFAIMLRDIGGGQNKKIDGVVVRRAGVDPTGGTDPHSPNVIWGPEWDGGGYGASLNNPNMTITFAAKANQVTVFARAYNRGTAPSDKAWFDVMCLLPRGDIPTIQIEPSVTPTLPATAVPPTAEIPPTNVPPTRVPPTPTLAPPTPTLEPAQILTATPESVAQKRPTGTPPPKRVIPTIVASNDGGQDGASNAGGGNLFPLAAIFGAVGIIAFSLLGIVAVGGFALWRIFTRRGGSAFEPQEASDDQNYYQ